MLPGKPETFQYDHYFYWMSWIVLMLLRLWNMWRMAITVVFIKRWITVYYGDIFVAWSIVLVQDGWLCVLYMRVLPHRADVHTVKLLITIPGLWRPLIVKIPIWDSTGEILLAAVLFQLCCSKMMPVSGNEASEEEKWLEQIDTRLGISSVTMTQDRLLPDVLI